MEPIGPTPAEAAPVAVGSGSWAELWRRPAYMPFYVTVVISRTFGLMFMTSGTLLVLDRTHSAALAGVVAAASTLPAAVTGPVLGGWLDVIRRRRLLIVIDKLLTAGALAVIVAAAGHAPDVVLPLAAVLYGATSPLSSGSFASALAALAGPELLDRASALDATSVNLAVVLGPALAAVLAATVGPARAVELQVVMTLLTAVAMATQPAFDAQGGERGTSVSAAIREGTRALVRNPVLRATGAAGVLASISWGLMVVVFPLFAATLHSARSGGGYLWAGLAAGSIIGTFALARAPSARRMSLSYAALGLSGLLWVLPTQLWAAVALVGFSGVLEGPAYSGTFAMRQRHAPAQARTQVLSTITSLNLAAMSIGQVAGGLLSRPADAFIAFCVLNLAAAAICTRARAAAAPA